MSDVLIQIGPAREGPDGVSWSERLDRLRALIRGLPSAVVAYSGGVDSSLVLRVAHEVLGPRALGVIGRSDSYATREMDLALAQAERFGAAIEVVATGELSDPAFRSNPVNRCYHCKSELYLKLADVARRRGAVILDGTIADDMLDWRPGRRAAAEHEVRSPLAELGFTKADVRAAAAHLGLESHDKPASPCLASRIPYGTEITRDNLGQVERAENLLRKLGLRDLRVRHHGDTARIEVPLEDLQRFVETGFREAVHTGLRKIGFRYVALDLGGLRSGSLNEAVGLGRGGVLPRPDAGSPAGAGPPEASTTGHLTHKSGTIAPGAGI